MEEYNHQLGENTGPRGSFLYGGPVVATPSSSVFARTSSGSNNQLPINSFHLHSSDECYEQSEGQQHPTVKTEAGGSSSHQQHGQHKFRYPSSIIRSHQTVQDHHHHHQQQQHLESENSGEIEAIKAKIVAHPQYPNLLEAYMDCQKVQLYTNNAILWILILDFFYRFSTFIYVRWELRLRWWRGSRQPGRSLKQGNVLLR